MDSFNFSSAFQFPKDNVDYFGYAPELFGCCKSNEFHWNRTRLFNIEYVDSQSFRDSMDHIYQKEFNKRYFNRIESPWEEQHFQHPGADLNAQDHFFKIFNYETPSFYSFQSGINGNFGSSSNVCFNKSIFK
jgi:hypothetical protein